MPPPRRGCGPGPASSFEASVHFSGLVSFEGVATTSAHVIEAL